MVVGALKTVVSVDVPLTITSSVAIIVSAYTVSPSPCTLTEAIPFMVKSTVYMVSPEGGVGVNRE